MSRVEVVGTPEYQITLSREQAECLAALFHGALPSGSGNQVLGAVYAQLNIALDCDCSDLYEKYERLVNSDHVPTRKVGS